MARPKIFNSPRFTLIKQDLGKIGIGALVAGAGAAITYVLDTLPGVDFGELTPMVVMLASIAANALRKWWGINQYRE